MIFEVKMQPEEVGAFAWLDASAVGTVVGVDKEETDQSSFFTVHQLNQDRTVTAVQKPSAVLSKKYKVSVHFQNTSRKGHKFCKTLKCCGNYLSKR